MAISAQLVQQLREKSSAGMMDCKKALESSNGDLEKAIQYLREKGKATAAQKAGRSTRQGLIGTWISSDQKKGSILEVNCETDFVARTKEFQDFLVHLTRQTGEKSIQSLDSLLSQTLNGSETVEILVKEKIAKLGENIQIKKMAVCGGNPSSFVGRYIHAPIESAPDCGSLGVLLEVETKDQGLEVKDLVRELCMQVAAASPKWIGKNDLDPAIVAKEKEIYKEQCRQSGKPEKAWDKIIDGKLADFFRQFCLLEQSHVRDSSGKTSIQSLVDSVSKTKGHPVVIKSFVRYKMGEE